ncbi:MAG: putative transport system permease protein [Sphingomonadales bacterium]|jgi:putative ABC transport system permease protein|nr:putative transport system permease protein [Sphingomonadales bacterium]
MWRNYLKVGYRALARNRVYSAINIVGLALGLAACLLILLYVRYETSYDKWLPDSDRIYQVQATWHEPGQPVTRNQKSPVPVRDTLAAGFPQIEAISVALAGRLATVRDGQAVWVDQLYVDPAFFDIFKLDFVQGSARTALPDVTSIVLTEREALKQFGTVKALGRTLTERISTGTYDYKVTGVIRDLPKNSHLRLATIARFDPHTWDDTPRSSLWGNMSSYHYVKLRPGADAAAINSALPAWEKRVIPSETIEGRTASRADIMDLKLAKVGDIHLGDAQLAAMRPGNDARTVTTFAIVAILILLMACINFVNLSTARAGQRAREVALRKVLGASRLQLVVQFLGESVLLAAVAMLLALAAVELAAPALAAWLDIELKLHYLGADGFLVPALLLVVVVGVAGGLYPAFYLSRFQPAQTLRANKASAETQGTGRLRTALVVTQFAISIGLIICTAIIYSQSRFVATIDPGFERDGLIQIGSGGRLTQSGNYEAFRKEALALPGVTGVARSNLGVAGAESKSIMAAKSAATPAPTDIGFYRIDPEFFPTTGMRLLAGRLLGEREAKDLVPRAAPGAAAPAGPPLEQRGLNVVVNRRSARQLGFRTPEAAIGQPIRVGIDGEAMIPSTIVGVVEDTRIRTARDEIEPIIFGYDPLRTSLIVVRYRGAVPSQVRQGLQRVWSRFLPDAPFEADFVEDLVAETYAQERARAAIFLGFAGFAVLIACLGLFGLAAFTTERRTKEIGIRKVLGARIRDIVQLLTWQFSKPVVIANLVAWPVAWWAMRDWLNSYDVRVPLGPGPFVMAGLLALAIAIGTVAGHAFRVARLNPIHALRYE